MRSLSREERAAKFSTKPSDAVGLRSRGHRKLSVSEQKSLLEHLDKQPPESRLENLRALREAARSSGSAPNFVATIYKRSVSECIMQGQFEPVNQMLRHLRTLEDEPKWRNLLIISLSNMQMFNEAYQLCDTAGQEAYTTSIVNRDIPLWENIVRDEPDPLTKALMKQLLPETTAFKQNLAVKCTRAPKSR